MGLSRARKLLTVLSGSGAAFTPTSITGLKLWLDFSTMTGLFQASDGTTPVTADGEPIGFATDKSTFGKNATQATTTAKPTWKANIQNGEGVARFDGGDLLSTASAQFVGTDGTWTAFAVVKATGNTGVQTIVDQDQGAGAARVAQHLRLNTTYADSIAFNTVEGPFVDTMGAAHGAAWVILSAVRDADSVELWQNAVSNGATATTGTPDAEACAVTIGANRPPASQALLTGDVGEALLYDSALSDANRQAVQNYLAAKWGITLS